MIVVAVSLSVGISTLICALFLQVSGVLKIPGSIFWPFLIFWASLFAGRIVGDWNLLTSW